MAKLKNPKHEKFAQEIIKGKTQREAYQKVYKAQPASASVAGNLLANQNQVKQRVMEILQRKETTSLDNIIENISEDLKAKKEVVYNNKGDIIEVRDNPTRTAAQQSLLKLYGAVGSVDNQTNIDARQVNVSIKAEDNAKLEQIADTLSKMNKKLDFTKGSQDGEVVEVVFKEQSEPTTKE